MPRRYLNKWHFKEKTVKFQADNFETVKIPRRLEFDPQGQIEMYHLHHLMAECEKAARAKRARKRYTLVVALGYLAGAALLLALWIGGR